MATTDPKPAKRLRDPAAVRRYLMTHLTCEVCQIRESKQAHHKLRRSQGGGDVPDNLLAVCARCHDLIHREPKWAYGKGWMRRSWDAW